MNEERSWESHGYISKALELASSGIVAQGNCACPLVCSKGKMKPSLQESIYEQQ